jgi:hypothetical protein
MPQHGPDKPEPGQGSHQNGLVIAALVVGALISGAAALGLMAGQSALPDTAQPRVQSSAPATGLSHAAATASLAAPFKSKWTGSKQPRWARDGSKTIAFELEAERDVAVWMKSVRPYLAVRCLYHNTEVMVLPDSAATIEPNDRHTVRIGFDAGEDVQQLWFGSDDHQALFAPDGAGLANQIASARTMRFSFTPYNAKPVVIEFDVRGFEDLIGLVSKTCGPKAARNPRGK